MLQPAVGCIRCDKGKKLKIRAARTDEEPKQASRSGGGSSKDENQGDEDKKTNKERKREKKERKKERREKKEKEKKKSRKRRREEEREAEEQEDDALAMLLEKEEEEREMKRMKTQKKADSKPRGSPGDGQVSSYRVIMCSSCRVIMCASNCCHDPFCNYTISALPTIALPTIARIAVREKLLPPIHYPHMLRCCFITSADPRSFACCCSRGWVGAQ
jgi:hypothetical protein